MADWAEPSTPTKTSHCSPFVRRALNDVIPEVRAAGGNLLVDELERQLEVGLGRDVAVGDHKHALDGNRS